MNMEKIHMQDELERLRLQILNMAGLVQQAIEKVTTAFNTHDQFLAEEVVDGDEKINSLEVEIHQQALRLLALQTPVARDLRFVLGCLQMSVDLERAADEAVNIAERVIILSDQPWLSIAEKMQDISSRALKMFLQSIQAVSSGDTKRAFEVLKLDNEVDSIHHCLIRDYIKYMTDAAPAVERCVHLIIIARRYERIGDLATNISEQVVFIEEGRNIKHVNMFDPHIEK